MLKYMRIDPVRALLILMIALPACKQAAAPPPSFDTQRALGTYEGSFGKGLLAVTINYINGDVVSGYDLHQGIRRNINGRLKADGAYLSFALREPGDRPEDGVLTFRLDTAKGTVKGQWRPLQSGKATGRDIELTRDASDGGVGYDLGSWAEGKDSVVTFHYGGYCEYKYYIHAEDSTSQLNTIRGSFAVNGNTVRIDWERNNATPARQMTLHFISTAVGGGSGETSRSLEGGGWTLNPVGSDGEDGEAGQ